MSFAFPKDARYENPRLLEGARGQPCQNCGAEDGTTVAAHDNDGAQKGIGKKGHDCYVAYLCHACHDYVDGRAGPGTFDPTGVWGPTRDDRRSCFWRAMRKTWLLWARWEWLKPT